MRRNSRSKPPVVAIVAPVRGMRYHVHRPKPDCRIACDWVVRSLFIGWTIAGWGTSPLIAGSPPRDAQTLRIEVDANDTIGPLPPLFRTGVWPFVAPPPQYIIDKTLTELHVSTMLIDIGHNVFKHAKNIQDVEQGLARLDDFLRRCDVAGAEIIIAVSQFPRWLSSRPNANEPVHGDRFTPVALVSPPRSYEELAQLMELVARHVRALGISATYQIGWEPDAGMWHGTVEEFFKLYRFAVLGIRRADPTARVGGPTLASLGVFARLENIEDKLASHRKAGKAPPIGRGAGSDKQPLLARFIAYCSQTRLPELGLQRLPLDFVAFHRFGGNNLTTYSYHQKMIEQWLVGSGYPSDTPIYVTEWSDTPEPFSPHREKSAIAAFIVANLVAMDAAGIDRHTYTCLTEQQVREDTQFGGGFGLFTKNFITRPSFAAFQALSRLADTRVEVEVDDRYLTAIASRDSDRVTIVVANFVPHESLWMKLFSERMLERGYCMADLRYFLKDQKRSEQIVRGKVELRSLGLPAEFEEDLQQVREGMKSFAKEMRQRSAGPISIELVVDDLDWLGSFTTTEYRIEDHRLCSDDVRAEIDQLMGNKRKLASKTIEQELDTMLASNGFAKREAQRFKDCLGANNRRACFEAAPRSLHAPIRAMLHTIKQRRHSEIAQLSETINMRPDVGLRSTGESPAQKSKQATYRLDLSPNGVALLVLERRRIHSPP